MVRKLLQLGIAAVCLLAGTSTFAAPARTAALLPGPQTQFSAMDARVSAFYGDINPFYGDINPFYGQISPFWGDITPFWGDINPFWGTVQPFYGPIDAFWGNISPFYGNINPFWGTVQPFWQDMGPVWGGINATWADLQASSATDYTGLQDDLFDFVKSNEAFWGDAVYDATGKNFMDGFATAVLERYGIDLDKPDTFADVSVEKRSAFFLAWYDGLMSFTGVDHVDWWMGAVHWSPMLTQIQASGSTADDVIVGLLDSAPSALDPSIQHLKIVGGPRNYTNGHGAAVGSLISAQHDGRGVMGIAPDAQVYLYNPFDATGTASFDEVERGINTLYAKHAHVINLSLGVPGSVLSSEWASIFQDLSMNPNNILFVKAAGNEGVTQTANVPWFGLTAPKNLILVGSVGPTGEISSFSNRPGEACITILTLCSEQNKLKYRFIVAPGELMLVSDNRGGVTRASGTSFAAPLVTGAVALLQTRWPWLQQHSPETVQIILQSADDLGAPGVDPVYGWGMLNVEASQSPLDFNDLVVYQPTVYRNKDFKTAGGAQWSPVALKAAVLSPGQLDLWQQQKAFIVAIENIGVTYRDFTIPLSSTIVNSRQKVNGRENPFQSYLYQRMIDWAGAGFADANTRSAQLSDGDWALTMTATNVSRSEFDGDAVLFHSEFVATNRAAGFTVRFGEGNGANALAGTSGLSLRSDFDPETGGVNPVLGFASGGAYARGEFMLGEDMRLSIGFSQQSDDHMYVDPQFGPRRMLPLSPYEAAASVIGIDYAVADGVAFNASYTHLNEATGLLGAQGSGGLNFAGGAQTDALTWSATVALPYGIDLMGSATLAQTGAMKFDGSVLSIADGGLQSTAYEFAAQKRGLFAETDRLRLSFAQPLHVESGALAYRSLQVVDRSTGELGVLAQNWSLGGGEREYRAEAIYATPVLEGRAELSGFAMLNLNPRGMVDQSTAFSLGAQIRIGL